MQERWWSLKSGSARFGVPEDKVRKALLSGDLVGIPSADGEDWLVRESDLLLVPVAPIERPTPRRVRSPSLLRIVLGLSIGVGAVALLTSSMGYSKCSPARPAVTQARLKQVAGMLELFLVDHGRYPNSLRDLFTKPDDIPLRDWPPGGTLSDEYGLQDGWGRDWIYRVPGADGRPYDLFSLGEDPEDPRDDVREPRSASSRR